MNKESIVLGSGDLYCTEFEGTDKELPTNEALETEENRLGYIKGGAEIEYAPSFYEAKDDMGKVSKVIITEEEATFKSGIMTWCGTTLQKLCQTARVTEDKAKKKRIVKIGGIGVAAHLFWLQINLIDCHRINRYNDISIEKEKVPEHLFFCRDKCSGTIYKHGYYIKIRNRIQ